MNGIGARKQSSILQGRQRTSNEKIRKLLQPCILVFAQFSSKCGQQFTGMRNEGIYQNEYYVLNFNKAIEGVTLEQVARVKWA